MTEFDLIPEDYRRQRALERDLFRGGVAIAGLVVLFALVMLVLLSLTSQEKKKAKILSSQQYMVDMQSDQIKALDAQIDVMTGQLTVLRGFRGGQTAPNLLLALDRALAADSVWLSSLEFGRAGSMVEQSQQASSNGYFIILPQKDANNPAKAWKIETHLELQGYAQNYVKLSDFVAQLLKQPEVDSVRVLRSDLRPHDKGQIVHFDIAIIVAGEGERK
ncbi:hypothetical protein [Zhongshania sp.]|uniref:hypothetical protein n=1 Tax=Zhongshania sp. TaxID=1971902 RepID=UPI003562E9F7